MKENVFEDAVTEDWTDILPDSDSKVASSSTTGVVVGPEIAYLRVVGSFPTQ